jgi:type II secretory pathway pseudopilin PulG
MGKKIFLKSGLLLLMALLGVLVMTATPALANTFSAQAQSSTSIAVNWNILGDIPGAILDSSGVLDNIYPITITETDPNGNTIKTWNNPTPDYNSSYPFTNLQPNTAYKYQLVAVWSYDDGSSDTTETLPCSGTTKAAGSNNNNNNNNNNNGGCSGTAPGPITNLNAEWYQGSNNTAVGVYWMDGADTTDYDCKMVGAGGESYDTGTNSAKTAEEQALYLQRHALRGL